MRRRQSQKDLVAVNNQSPASPVVLPDKDKPAAVLKQHSPEGVVLSEIVVVSPEPKAVRKANNQPAVNIKPMKAASPLSMPADDFKPYIAPWSSKNKTYDFDAAFVSDKQMQIRFKKQIDNVAKLSNQKYWNHEKWNLILSNFICLI